MKSRQPDDIHVLTDELQHCILRMKEATRILDESMKRIISIFSTLAQAKENKDSKISQ